MFFKKPPCSLTSHVPVILHLSNQSHWNWMVENVSLFTWQLTLIYNCCNVFLCSLKVVKAVGKIFLPLAMGSAQNRFYT